MPYEPTLNTSSDEQIRKAIEAHLVHESRQHPFEHVIVEVRNGCVTLSGTVPHSVMKKEIADMAESVPGVRRVENHLNVPLTAAWPT